MYTPVVFIVWTVFQSEEYRMQIVADYLNSKIESGVFEQSAVGQQHKIELILVVIVPYLPNAQHFAFATVGERS